MKMRKKDKKKQKRDKRHRLASSQKPGKIIIEYYQHAFRHLIKEIRESGKLESNSLAERQSFWQLVPPQVYESDEGQDIVHAYLLSLERKLKTLVSRNSIAYWLHVFRRLSPKAIGEDERPITIFFTRAAMDAAVQKWASFELCHRIAKSSEVPSSAVLRGFLVQHEHVALLQSLAAQPQLVLTDFGSSELLESFEVETHAADAYWCMTLLRSLGKGAGLNVTGDRKNPAGSKRTPELDSLISSYDTRNTPFNASATATVFDNSIGKHTKGIILLPQFNTGGTSFTQLRPIFKSFLGAMPLGEGEPNFVWTPFNLLSYYESHCPFGEAFEKKNSVSLESVLATICVLCASIVSEWHSHPEVFWHSWQRAYDGPIQLEGFRETLQESMPRILDQIGLPFDSKQVSVHDAMEFLTLQKQNRDQIDIAYPGPHYIFLPCGDEHIFVDYAYIYFRLFHLFHGVQVSDQNFKGLALELFTRQGRSVLPSRQLKAADGTSRQIDAAFEVGEILIIAECRAVSTSIAVERGSPRGLEKRRNLVEKILDDVDEKANWLAAHIKGRNYDVSKFRAVLPIGVTPFKEFIPSIAPRYWISSKIPRVLAPTEIFEALKDGTLLKAASNCHNLVRLG